jgi:hypothetical protein
MVKIKKLTFSFFKSNLFGPIVGGPSPRELFIYYNKYERGACVNLVILHI